MNILLFLVVGFGLTAATISENVYRPEREYVYDYDVQILSGLPETSKTTAGLVLNCKVRLVFKTATDIIVKMENVRLWHLMKELPTVPTVDTYLPIEQFIPVETEKFIALERELVKPCVAKWENGLVVMMKVAVDEPEWSINMKKALLNTIHLDLSQTTTSQVNDVTFSGPEITSTVFNTKEMNSFGECEPMYTIQPTETMGSAEPIIKVIKIVEPVKCKNRPLRLLANIYPEICDDCDEDQRDVLKSTVKYEYDLLGSTTKFSIKRAEMTSVHILAPMRPRHGTITQFIRAKLTFVRSKEVDTSSIPLPELRTVPEILRLKFEEGVTESPVFMGRRFKPEMLTELENKIETLARIPSDEKPEVMLELIPILKEAGVQDLKLLIERMLAPSIHAATMTEEKMEIKRTLLTHILPYVRTHEVVFVIKSLLTTFGRPDCILSPYEAAIMLTHLSVGAKPTKYIADQLLEICQLVPISSNEMTKKAAWMAYGNVMKRLLIDPAYVQERGTMPPVVNDVAFINKHLEVITKPWSTAHELLAVQVMAMVPLPELMPKCVSIARDAKKPLIVRVAAMESMEIQAFIRPRKVLRTCLTILMDKSLPAEVRISAFRNIHSAKPDTATLHHIVSWLSREPDTHVASYCYSYLVGISKSDIPCYRKLATQLRYVLKTVPPMNPGIQFSKAFFRSFYSDALREGVVGEVSYITTPKSLLPKTWKAKAGAYVFGRYISLFEVTAYTEGLQELVEKVIGPTGSLKNSDSVFDLVRRNRRDLRSSANIASHYQPINEKLRAQKYTAERPKITIFAKLFEHEMPFLDINEGFLANMMEDGRMRIEDIDDKMREGFPLKYKKHMIIDDIERTLPTAVGLPIKVKMSSVVSLNMDGKLRMFVEPRLFRGERNSQIPHQVKVDLDAKPDIATYTRMTVELDIPVLKIGSEAKMTTVSKFPLKMTTMTDPSRMKTDMEFHAVPNAELLTVKMTTDNVMMIMPTPVTELTTMVPENAMIMTKSCATIPEYQQRHTTTSFKSCPVTRMLTNVEIDAKWYENIHAAGRWGMMAIPPFTPTEFTIGTLPSSVDNIDKILVSLQMTPVVADSPDNDWPLIRHLPEAETIKYYKSAFAMSTMSSGVKKDVMQTKFYWYYEPTEGKLLADVHWNMFKLDGAPIEICIAGKSTVPTIPEFYTRPLPAGQFNWPLTIEFNFGKCHSGKPALKATFTVKKSEQQIGWEAEHTSWPEYRECMEQPEHIRHSHPACMKLMGAWAMARGYHVVVDSDRTQIPSSLLAYMRRCPYMLKCPVLKEAWDPRKPAKQHIVLDLAMVHTAAISGKMPSITTDMIKYKMSFPEEEPVSGHVRLPWSMPALSLKTPYHWLLAEHFTNDKIPAKCVVEPGKLTTFDGRMISFSLEPNCEVILAKDCSSDTGMVATVKKVDDGEKKILKIIVSKYVVLVEPAAYTAGAPIVTVNGVRYPMTEHWLLKFPTETDAELIVKKSGDDSVMIKYPVSGFGLTTNGISIEAEISPLKYGKMCGLCGNFDGLEYNDNITPSLSRAASYRALVRSFQLPSSQCPAVTTEPIIDADVDNTDTPSQTSSIFDW